LKDENIQNLVNELSKDISKDAQFRAKLKSIAIKILIVTILSLVIGVGSYLAYLYFSLQKVERDLALKQNTIDDLESSLNSIMYAEQLREESALRIIEGENWSDDRATKRLERIVLENLKTIESASMDHKGINVHRGNEKYPEIALTFDLASGSELSFIEHLIKKYNVRVTLFLSNERASDTSGSFFLRSNLDAIQRLAKTGKVEFANHTWSHYNYVRSIHETSPKKRKVLEYISPDVLNLERMAEEMYRVETTFNNLTGKELKKYYRLPYGALNTLILNAHASLGYSHHIMWSYNSVGSLDIPDYIYKQFITRKDKNGKPVVIKNPFYKTSREALDFLYRWEKADDNGMNGAIILMHLGSPRKFDKLIHILPEFIETMQKKGYRFRTVSEVLNDSFDS
jgi:peptidoglycan/xylan/chitin deacetylase (PgdA/CDA1 family)